MEKRKKISIRTVQRNDIPHIIELLQLISEFKPSKNEHQKIWESLRRQKNFQSFVAVMDDNVVGYGAIFIISNIRGGKLGQVEDIVSHPDFSKKGVGKMIMDTLFMVAKANGCYKIALQCKEHNVEFYKKCKYEINGISMQRFLSDK